MREKILDWFGSDTCEQSLGGLGHSYAGHDHGEGGHIHSVIDPTIAPALAHLHVAGHRHHHPDDGQGHPHAKIHQHSNSSGDHGHSDHDHSNNGQHHASDPVITTCDLAVRVQKIVDTPQGEQMHQSVAGHIKGLTAMVIIDRPDGPETLFAMPAPNGHRRLQRAVQPHGFDTHLVLHAGGKSVDLPFHMSGPESHAAH